MGKSKMIFKLLVIPIFIISVFLAFSGHSYGAELKVFRVALTPQEAPSELLSETKPMADYLTKKLGIKTEMTVVLSYGSLVEALRAKHVEMGRINPVGFVIAKEEGVPIEPICVFVRAKDKKPGYRGVFIVRKDSDIYSMGDLRGKSFAFTSPGSTSGYLIPTQMFKRFDIDTEKDMKVTFSGGHTQSILALKNKHIDACATADTVFDKGVKKGLFTWDEFRVLLYTDMIFGPPWVIRTDLPKDLVAKAKKALLDMDPQIISSFRESIGWQEVTARDYDNIAEVIKTVGIRKYKEKLKKPIKKK
jgi:phosphonate transport system substrate-binding protein